MNLSELRRNFRTAVFSLQLQREQNVREERSSAKEGGRGQGWRTASSLPPLGVFGTGDSFPAVKAHLELEANQSHFVTL